MKQIFESENIIFVEVSHDLVQDYLTMVNDTENVGWFIGHLTEPFSEEQERQWVDKKLALNAVCYSMIEKNTGEFIGNIEIMDIRTAPEKWASPLRLPSRTWVSAKKLLVPFSITPLPI
ncbi:MAG: hypothetical protein IJI05_04745 [Erysipelotrichaceae bacterium]|nr:hypothetical protein [Erysipelotrichaceae bacterium]